MVICKRIDHKELSLGSDVLKETNEYKFLGVYFFRSLSFSYHINCYLKENFEKKYNYIIKLLGEHGSFNRISFGDALWKYIIHPSIAHGCAVDSKHQYEHPKVSFILRIGMGTDK